MPHDPSTRPPGVSTVTWRELLALAHDDPTAHGHLTMWRLGKLGDAEMLAQLAVAQTQRVRELTAKCVQLMERAGPAVVVAGGERTEPGP